MFNKTHSTIGWDIGGAHVKAALVDKQGVAQQVYQLSCPLWRGPEELVQVIKQLKMQLPADATSAVTMTGELVDFFPNRHVGVCEIANVMHMHLNADTRFYAGRLGWLPYAEVESNTSAIASMNWHASASFVANHIRDGIFLDIGSTTSDIIPIREHALKDVGETDAQRMSRNGLVYTGVVRTPLMALAPAIAFNGMQYSVAAEYFATTADIYRLLGQLPEIADQADTADGQDKSARNTARRIARMIGHDVEDAELSAWVQLAQQFKTEQQKRLMTALQTHMNGQEPLIIGVGVGVFLGQELAHAMNCPFLHGEQLVQAKDNFVHQQAVNCFPAYAVARLAA